MMTYETIEKAFDAWRKTLTIVDRPSNQEIFSQGYVSGWNAKKSADKLVFAGGGTPLSENTMTLLADAIFELRSSGDPTESTWADAIEHLAAERDALRKSWDEECEENAQLSAQITEKELLLKAPTKEEIELRLAIGEANAEVVRTQDELGALLHHAEAQLARANKALDEISTTYALFRAHEIAKAALTS